MEELRKIQRLDRLVLVEDRTMSSSAILSLNKPSSDNKMGNPFFPSKVVPVDCLPNSKGYVLLVLLERVSSDDIRKFGIDSKSVAAQSELKAKGSASWKPYERDSRLRLKQGDRRWMPNTLWDRGAFSQQRYDAGAGAMQNSLLRNEASYEHFQTTDVLRACVGAVNSLTNVANEYELRRQMEEDYRRQMIEEDEHRQWLAKEEERRLMEEMHLRQFQEEDWIRWVHEEQMKRIQEEECRRIEEEEWRRRMEEEEQMRQIQEERMRELEEEEMRQIQEERMRRIQEERMRQIQEEERMRRIQEEERMRQIQEEERMRQVQERMREIQAEEERMRKVQEERMRQIQEEERMKRMRKIQEEEERMRQAQEEHMRQIQEEERMRRLREIQEEEERMRRLRKIQEEEERMRRVQEERMRQIQEEEWVRRTREIQEEEERMRRVKEEHMRQIQEEEQMRQIQEERMRQIHGVERMRRIQDEEYRRIEEDEWRRQVSETEWRRQMQEEQRRIKEEEWRRQSQEDERRKQIQKEQRRTKEEEWKRKMERESQKRPVLEEECSKKVVEEEKLRRPVKEERERELVRGSVVRSGNDPVQDLITGSLRAPAIPQRSAGAAQQVKHSVAEAMRTVGVTEQGERPGGGRNREVGGINREDKTVSRFRTSDKEISQSRHMEEEYLRYIKEVEGACDRSHDTGRGAVGRYGSEQNDQKAQHQAVGIKSSEKLPSLLDLKLKRPEFKFESGYSVLRSEDRGGNTVQWQRRVSTVRKEFDSQAERDRPTDRSFNRGNQAQDFVRRDEKSTFSSVTENTADMYLRRSDLDQDRQRSSAGRDRMDVRGASNMNVIGRPELSWMDRRHTVSGHPSARPWLDSN